MPDRPSSSPATPNLLLLFGLVASMLGLAMVGTGVSDPLLSAAPVARLAASRAPVNAASAGTPTAAAPAIRRKVFTARRDRVLDSADPHDALLPLATLLRGPPLERPPGYDAAPGTSEPLPVLWLPPPPSPTDQLSPQNGVTLGKPNHRAHFVVACQVACFAPVQ